MPVRFSTSFLESNDCNSRYAYFQQGLPTVFPHNLQGLANCPAQVRRIFYQFGVGTMRSGNTSVIRRRTKLSQRHLI